MMASPKQERIRELQKEQEQLLEDRDKLVYQLAENELSYRRNTLELHDLDPGELVPAFGPANSEPSR